jgi:hypothetical protein
LPKSTKMDSDQHYKCFRCLYGRDDDDDDSDSD